MIYRVLADGLVVFHMLFVAFVLLGGLLVLRYRWLIWLHVPAAIWGVIVEMLGLLCPLTPLENHLRRLGGENGYEGGFVEHYLLPVLYPQGSMTHQQFIALQVGIGSLVLVINLTVYGLLIRRAYINRTRAR